MGENTGLGETYDRKKESFQVLGIPTSEEIWYYNMYAGKNQDVLWNIVKRHIKPFRNHSGQKEYGAGIYLDRKPDTSKGQRVGVVACRVLPGNKFIVNTEDLFKADIPEGYQSKVVTTPLGEVLVVTNPDQVLPLAAITCSTAPDEPKPGRCAVGGASASSGLESGSGDQGQQPRDPVAEQMGRLFEHSLKLHLTGQHMKACDAITTELYPHQMYALA